MGEAATGAQVLFGWRREQQFSVPGSEARVYLRPVPPLSADLLRALLESPEINQSGARQASIPGAITGPLDVAVALNAATLLEPLENILGEVAKTELETGAVYKYVATPNRTGANTSLDAILSKPPVARGLRYGGKLSSLTTAISSAGVIPARLAGFFSHGTSLSAATADGGNTGTYAKGPHLRGLLKKARAGEVVHVDVTRDVAGGGLQYKAERVPSSGAAPTFPGAAQNAAYDADNKGAWQNLLGTYQLTGTMSVTISTAAVTGVGTKFLSEIAVGQYLTLAAETIKVLSIASDTALTLATNHTAGASAARGYIKDVDFGIWEENYDPLEVIFPGDTTAQGDIDIGDAWSFNVDWTDPAATYIAAQRFTGAHFVVEYRKRGATTWIPVQATSAAPVIAWGLTPDIALGSRYYFALDRDLPLAPTCQLQRKYRDNVFRELNEAHEHFELRVRWLGQQLGTGANRESIEYEWPFVAVQSISQPVASSQAIQETVQLVAEEDPDGDPVVTVTLITDRNWTPTAV